MRAAIIHGAHDVRVAERPDPTVREPTDAVIRTVATCVCGSDLWRYRGLAPVPEPKPIGHEYVGVVEEIGDAVNTLKPGDFVVGGFLHSDNRCPVCRKGMQSACPHGGGFDGCQAERIRIPNADGTLIATPGRPDADLVPSLLALSDVMGTGWHAAVSADVRPGSSVVVVGDGAVGLCGVLASAQLGATTIIAMSRHADRQAVATEFGATHVVPERGEDGLARVRELTEGIGADAVLECVGTEEARLDAVEYTRPGGMIGVVGLPHGDLPTDRLFWSNKGIRGGPAPVRAYLPHLIDLVWARQIDPGRVFDLTLPLSEVAEAYRAMDERRAIKVLLQP
ncbi:zinc-dependent alcohol dehydrogenase family protein [Cellulomonas fengjieae]|uniref:Zinc-dependent alcohol dehydrogenase family protein n=1 Tax=Cellulomonas fengjieae TaxID=2819978 RepID=A0ABS3SJ66_9CELL|nr:zinc-dependent alcohol dehydrogenase family protein [Cellulomonas fengjieae]MBO3085794.1 zinc-dependent alcohol dehydrogenase family protein [Cellulomonas fengjieae]QVI67502.1 zinc-dependent alcohol dehydrogenase family protein [Cellulomonas fengjieae]